jgi:hypothetical protein
MTGKSHRRKPVPDRARKRAIRAHAARTGMPYSVAARHLDMFTATELAALTSKARDGRTIYPVGTDTHRQWLVAARERRPFAARVQDTRRAADLPIGRADHLAERFPPTRGEPGTEVGPLYNGECRQAAIAMVYMAVAHEKPHLVPTVGELAWTAELGEETAVDITCAKLDRAARLLLDGDRWGLWTRLDAALTIAEQSRDKRVRGNARQLAADLRTASLRTSMDGARHILDALLMVGDDGHAPGTRVRILLPPNRGRLATIVGARWGAAGPPSHYEVRPDAIAVTLVVHPHDLSLDQPQATLESVDST